MRLFSSLRTFATNLFQRPCIERDWPQSNEGWSATVSELKTSPYWQAWGEQWASSWARH